MNPLNSLDQPWRDRYSNTCICQLQPSSFNEYLFYWKRSTKFNKTYNQDYILQNYSSLSMNLTISFLIDVYKNDILKKKTKITRIPAWASFLAPLLIHLFLECLNVDSLQDGAIIRASLLTFAADNAITWVGKTFLT